MTVSVNTARFEEAMHTISTFREEGTRQTRRSFTEPYFQARSWLAEQMKSAGLLVETDAAGNLVGRLIGRRPDLPEIAIGSHTDTVADGGAYDGIIGVLGGLEVARALQDAKIQLTHTLRVIDFLAEEPSAFGVSTVGSRGLAGELTPEMLTLRGPDGSSLADAIRMAGGVPKHLGQPLLQQNSLHAFVELHIEQGPVLERESIDVGVVTGIAGISRFRVHVTGDGGHAGTVPMKMRNDALTAAAEMVLTVQSAARHTADDGDHCVATVGYLVVHPNHANVIPDDVTFIFEVRSLDSSTLSSVPKKILDEMEDIAGQTGVTFRAERLSISSPVVSNESVLRCIETACNVRRLTHTRMTSGAGHDAAKMASLCPVGMIFVPSHKGISHTPEEFTEMEQVIKGVATLAETVCQLDNL